MPTSRDTGDDKDISENLSEDQRRRCLRDLRFPPPLEQMFHADYDRKTLPGLRAGLLLLLALLAAQGLGALALGHGIVGPALACLASVLFLVVVSLHPRFASVWQPAVVATFCLLAWLLLRATVQQHPPPGVGSGAADGAFRANTLLLNELMIVIVGFALTRLRFVWFAVGSLMIAALTVTVAARSGDVALPLFLGGTSIFVMPALAALMFVAYLQERTTRGEFLANYQLDRERAGERRQREQTEAMLHVLSQAIGGIVHDLGNPLTSVRTGAETLRVLNGPAEEDREEDRDGDRALAGEILDIISDGALMLDYLRLSLLEQTRVLEGKPTQLQCEPVSIRQIVDAGAQYQKPKFTQGRRVSAVGDDLTLQADKMRMITVFMNLLGNALKYSDGEVRIVWQSAGEVLLCGVLDQGRSRRGISPAQARQLFVPFGRLETHSAVEGTGLGLLSAQSIVEAHGGELFIEGYADGTPASAPFSTARNRYPSLLAPDSVSGGFVTGFVVACPAGRPDPLVGAAERFALPAGASL